MRNIRLLLCALIATAFFLVGGSFFGEGLKSKIPSGAAKLEGMEYISARKIVLSLGWHPLMGNCLDGNDHECTIFPEIGNCSDVSPGFCDMTFYRKGKCLTLITKGGRPQNAIRSGVKIDGVIFGRSPCSKDPNE